MLESMFERRSDTWNTREKARKNMLLEQLALTKGKESRWQEPRWQTQEASQLLSETFRRPTFQGVGSAEMGC
jgi:hypothetical protein